MASLNLRSRFGLFVSGLNIPFPGNGDCGSKRPDSTANRRTVTIRSRLPPCAPLLPLVSSATRRLLNLTRIQSGRPSIHPAFLGYDVERLMKSVVNDARGLEGGSAGKPAWIDHGQRDGVDQHPRKAAPGAAKSRSHGPSSTTRPSRMTTTR